ncbi:peroxisomal copper amine oxidase [Metarhizium robertsii ARSEF 23]|uniref:Peroxisomal copper amine oxidase n=1 Tax=Metarhizium robertsii (strain ARSEF 23 / ATCC MYA-3075) TaxID=655844 RepID=A0A0B2XHB1_METRA|nr:peroxisomal copper amine oxidase [Metarhizium robertsii ARSEF 23]KHO10947.1 peroxisomal copper amine oxidase [Metarhizium robertsii ARSEF 23]
MAWALLARLSPDVASGQSGHLDAPSLHVGADRPSAHPPKPPPVATIPDHSAPDRTLNLVTNDLTVQCLPASMSPNQWQVCRATGTCCGPCMLLSGPSARYCPAVGRCNCAAARAHHPPKYL